MYDVLSPNTNGHLDGSDVCPFSSLIGSGGHGNLG